MNNYDEIERIMPLPLPFDPNDKIFYHTDEEGNIIGEPYSLHDWHEEIRNIAGVSQDLMGKD